MSGEIELLPTRDLTAVLGHDAGGLAGRSNIISFSGTGTVFAGSGLFNGTLTALRQINIGTSAGTAAGMTLNSATGIARAITYATAGVTRWQDGVNSAAEIGSNAGSDRYWNAFDDNGALLGTVLKLTRSTLLSQFGGGVYINPGVISLSGATQTSSQIGLATNQSYAGSMSGGGEVYANNISVVDTCQPTTGHTMSWLNVGGQVGNIPWGQGTSFATNSIVDNGGNVYKATTGGTSAASGTGPSGTGVSIADNTITWTYQGSAWHGKRNAIQTSLSIRSQQSSPAGGTDSQWVAITSTVAISATQGGTGTLNGQGRGVIYGGGDQVWAYSGATNLLGVVGRETDVGVFAGASAYQRTGWQLVSYGDNQGTIDTGIRVSASGSGASSSMWAPGFKNVIGLQFGAVDPNGAILAYMPPDSGQLAGSPLQEPPPKADRGIDLTAYNFTTGSFKSAGGFIIDGIGAANIGLGKISSSSTGLSVNAVGSQATAIAINSGGTNYDIGDQLFDTYGNLITVTTVGANNAITGISVNCYAGTTQSSPSSTGVSFRGGSGNQNATFNITWAASTKVNVASNGSAVIGSSSGSLGFFGNTGVIKPTVNGSKASNAALASLMTALSSLGLLADSTT